MKLIIAAGLLAIASAAGAQDTTTKVGSWSVKRTVDSFSDAKRGIAMTEVTTAGTIVVKCDTPGPDSLYVSIITSKYLGSDRIRRSYSAELNKVRFDDAAPESLPRTTYDGRSAHMFSAQATSFLSRLARDNPKRVRLQLVTYDSDIVTADFDVTGVADAIKQTAAICEDTRFG